MLGRGGIKLPVGGQGGVLHGEKHLDEPCGSGTAQKVADLRLDGADPNGFTRLIDPF